MGTVESGAVIGVWGLVGRLVKLFVGKIYGGFGVILVKGNICLFINIIVSFGVLKWGFVVNGVKVKNGSCVNGLGCYIDKLILYKSSNVNMYLLACCVFFILVRVCNCR